MSLRIYAGSVLLWLLAVAAVSQRSSASSVGSFTEGEASQVIFVTSHGAPVTEHILADERMEAKLEACSQDEQDEQDEIFTDETDTEDDPATANATVDLRGLPRDRRVVVNDVGASWPKGIVPYDFDPVLDESGRAEVRAGFTRWHKYTCIRFVPWVLNETKQEHGLTEESHITFTVATLPGETKCAAYAGNKHDSKGQSNKCCRRYACTHELGHSLGLSHEQQSPDRTDFLRINPHFIEEDWERQYRLSSGISYQYDVSSDMHYGGKGTTVLYMDLRELIWMSNQFYMYKDASTFNKCYSEHCSDFAMHCANDGFVTLVDNQCSCLCPPGLDPATGCNSVVKSVTTSQVWPSGAYALLSSNDGCPDDTNIFIGGSWSHSGGGRNDISGDFHLAGEFNSETFVYEFCVKDSHGDVVTAPAWETGVYCVLRAGGVCPDGFEQGFIQFDDADNSTGEAFGELPDGNFSSDTRLEFCCRTDGFVETPLSNLPNTRPFVLFPGNEHTEDGRCQEVAGMRWTEEFFHFDSLLGIADQQGSIPYIYGETGPFKIKFCYYTPLNLDCGGEVTLSSNQREAIITSPNYPATYGTSMECTWLIKAEENGQVLLEFDVMKISADGDGCPDSLEIRYNLPGQPGVRYCGDGLGKTIHSMNGVILLTLRTDLHHDPAAIGFTARASISLPAEECIDRSTKGVWYRGKKNYTRSMWPCLPWSDVTHCPHHLFNPLDFHAGLEDNYCRNPDKTAQPWCYTHAKGCLRDYCDVCNQERVYDRRPDCNLPGVCDLQVDALQFGCAFTCNTSVDVPPPNREDTCRPPEALPDADIVGTIKTSYSQGETITYQCRKGYETLSRICLSGGQWSDGGYVCGGCSPGWSYHNGACYKYFGEVLKFDEAREKCAENKAVVSSMKNEKELNFVADLVELGWKFWSGLTDKEEEGKFVWQDGTPASWTNWAENQPNDYRDQDCVEVKPKSRGNTWKDVSCDTESYVFVCQLYVSDRTVCADRFSDCRNILTEYPEVCREQPEFANQRCPYSCALCQPDATPSCPTPSANHGAELVRPTGQESVKRGETVEMRCEEGLVLTGGQLVRACGEDGNLFGQHPICQDPDTIVQEINDVALIPRPYELWSTFAIIGFNLRIYRRGVIKQWRYYSSQPGWLAFQVWRPGPSPDNSTFQFVGQNLVYTQGHGLETAHVQQVDWIHVQSGDILGTWQGSKPRGRVQAGGCSEEPEPDNFWVTYSEKRQYIADFSPNRTEAFRISTKMCRVLSFKAVVYPENVSIVTDVATNHVPLLDRSSFGDREIAYLGDGDNFRVPVDGLISEWQFFVEGGGSAAFQVWRPRPDEEDLKYEFIGQNVVKLDDVTVGEVRNVSVPPGERIAVKAGDLTSILYGKDRLLVPYTSCNATRHPEATKVRQAGKLQADTMVPGQLYNFQYSTEECQIFSFRAIVTKA